MKPGLKIKVTKKPRPMAKPLPKGNSVPEPIFLLEEIGKVYYNKESSPFGS